MWAATTSPSTSKSCETSKFIFPPSFAIPSSISLSSLISLTKIGKLHLWTPEGHLDSWHIARTVFQGVQDIGARPFNCKLSGLAAFFGFELNAHDACADAVASWQVLIATLKQAQVMQDSRRWENSTIPLIARHQELEDLHAQLELYAHTFSTDPPPPIAGHITLSIDDEVDDERMCTICWGDARSHAFVPCGHKCICGDCAKNLFARCPICNTVVGSIVQIFDS